MQPQAIIFDIGRVVVDWQPAVVLAKFFSPEQAEQLANDVFLSQIWLNYDQGLLGHAELVAKLAAVLKVMQAQVEQILAALFDSLQPFPAMPAFLEMSLPPPVIVCML